MTLASQPAHRIRPARHEDLDRILEVETRSFQRPWTRALMARELDHAWSTVLVIEAASDPAGASPLLGFAVFWIIEDEIHLLDIAVDPDRRRQGIGRALMCHLLDLARDRDARFVSLEVRRSNVAAQALYTSLGFAAIGLRRNYYREEREDAIVMEWSP